MANLLHNRYQILKSLGESPSGPTVLAEDIQSPTRQRCVVKPLNAIAYPPDQGQQIQANFSQALAKLEAASIGHAQIPDLYGYFVEKGIFYWVREWIEGRPLKDFTAAQWSEQQVRAFLISALKALAHIHQQNVLHLNLKPSNIIVREADKHPCLVGIGSKALSAIAAEKPILVRTAGFTAPEQTMGKPIMASDIYSLGMTAIHLLTTVAPLKIPTDKSNGRLLWRPFAPKVSDRFAGVLTRAIHPSAPIRFASAIDMLAVLQQPTPAQPVKPAPAAPPTAPPTTSPTVVAPKTIFPQSSPSSQPLEETVVSTPSSRSVAPPAAFPQAAATVTPTARASAATAVSPEFNHQSNRSNNNFQSNSNNSSSNNSSSNNSSSNNSSSNNRIYSLNGPSKPWYQQSFFKWWAGGLVGSIGIGALILLSANGFSRSSPTIDASSPEVLNTTIDTLEEQIENNPDNEQASLALIEAYLYGGNIEAADGVIDDLLDEDNNNANALYQQGRLQFFQSDYAGAIASLEDAVTQDSRNGQAAVMLGRAYQEVGDYNNAATQFETALSLPNAKGEAHLNLSYLNHLQGETQAALNQLDAAARFFKGNDRIKIHTQRSALYFDLRERDKAEAEWEAAIALSPNNPEAYVHQSISKFFLGDSEGAIANLEQALAINPNFTEAYAMESLIHLNQGDLEAAIAAINAAVAIDEFSTSALKIIADVVVSTPEPNLEFALTAMDQALAINPNNPYILNQRCSFMLAVKEVDTAIDNCTRSIQVNANNVEAYNTRGQAHLSQFDFVSAEADFTRIIEINEEIGRAPDAAAYAQRAAARTGLEDREGAKADLDRALEINSEE